MSSPTANNIVRLELVNGVGENYRFDANTILDAAKEHDFQKFVLIGEFSDPEKREDEGLYVAGNANFGETLILMELAKLTILGR